MELIQIKNSIEKMNKNHQIEIFKIINKNNIDFNENQNGIFVNLTNLNTDILQEIKDYIIFVNKQNNFLNKQEEIKENYINNFFKDNTDNYEQSKSNDDEPSGPPFPSYAV